MPILSVFFGITIRVYFEDHAPPHIHVEYGDHRAIVEIETGAAPRRTAAAALQTAGRGVASHSVAELRVAWKAAQSSKLPRRIRPLD